MRLLLSTMNLDRPGGSETCVLATAEALGHLGHEAVVHATRLGAMSDVARARGLQVIGAAERLPPEVDGVIAHDGASLYELAGHFPGAARIVVVHSADLHVNQPPLAAGVAHAAVALNDRVQRRLDVSAFVGEVVRLRQPIDLRRFAVLVRLPDRPRRALLLSSYLDEARRAIVRAACERAGLELDEVGRGEGSLGPVDAMPDGDIVFGYGRSVLEAMASGRAAYVLDRSGTDGWVTPEAYPRLEADGFCGGATDAVLDAARLERDLQQGYSHTMGLRNRELVRHRHNSRTHAAALVELVERHRDTEPPPPGPLDELARLTRLQFQENARALDREARLREVDACLLNAQARAEYAEARLAELRSTRRFRLMQAAMRPLDRLRGR